MIPAFQTGDSIKIEASGYETLVLAVDSIILSTGKVKASLIKSSAPINKINYPSLKLTNQNPVTSNNIISFEVTAQNVLT